MIDAVAHIISAKIKVPATTFSVYLVGPIAAISLAAISLASGVYFISGGDILYIRYGAIANAIKPGATAANAHVPQLIFTPALLAKSTHRELGATEVINIADVIQLA